MSQNFYYNMGPVRCQKIKKHAGIKLRPTNKAKDPFLPGDMLIYSCESADHTTHQTIKCLDDGRWSEIPHCLDPTNFTCPDFGTFPNGSYNSSAPFKVGTIVSFRCDNEFTPPSPKPLVSNPMTPSFLQQSNATNDLLETPATATINYNLTGSRLLKCLPSAKWNHPPPICMPEQATGGNSSLMLTSVILILIPILIIIAIAHLFIRWKKRQQQRARWRQYFTDYKYRHSKTSITLPQSSTATIPVTDL